MQQNHKSKRTSVRVECLPEGRGGEEAKPGIDIERSKLDELMGKNAMKVRRRKVKGRMMKKILEGLKSWVRVLLTLVVKVKELYDTCNNDRCGKK